MCSIKNAWLQQRIEYQLRYVKACEKYESCENDTEFYKGEYEGAMHEMSWVPITVFGLTSKEVQEVERNKGFTNSDIDSDEVTQILHRMNVK